MRALLLEQQIRNFMGVKSLDITFPSSSRNIISGQNGTGKTTTKAAHYWLLFGENANGDSKFGIRPVDENGSKIHDIVISVSEKFRIDSENHILTKRQKENWVKKRGSDVPALQGNINEYEIDGYPKSEAEFSKWVEENLCSDEIGKILSSPEYFPSMGWKDQRKILFKAVSPMSDYEIADKQGGFDDIKAELKAAGDADTVRAKYAKSLKELKKQQEELPVRVDEISQQKVDVDKSELESIETKIKELDEKINPLSDKLTELHRSTDGLLDMQFELNDLKRQLEDKRQSVRNQIKDQIFEEERTVRNKEDEKRKNDLNIDEIGSLNKALKNSLDESQKKLDECMSEKVTTDDTCPYCGQKLPKDQLESALKKAEDEHNKMLSAIHKDINVSEGNIEANLSQIEKLKTRNTEIDREVEDIQKRMFDLRKKLDGTAPIEDEELEKNISEKKSEVETAQVNLARMQTIEADVRKLESERDPLAERRAELQSTLRRNSTINERIKELHEEQLDVAQKVTDCEKVLFSLDKFTKFKADFISNEVNSRFSIATFKLFDQQINGGIKETCELQYRGVSYSDLNFGGRLRVGLDLIQGLSTIFDISLPVFLDFAESINEKNVPDIEPQLIELRVTDEKTLTVH